MILVREKKPDKVLRGRVKLLAHLVAPARIENIPKILQCQNGRKNPIQYLNILPKVFHSSCIDTSLYIDNHSAP